MKLQSLLEAVEDLAKKYDVLYKHLTSRQERVKTALEQLSQMVPAAVVYNADFNEVKSTLSRSLENTLHSIEAEANRDELRELRRSKMDGVQFYDISVYVQLNQTAKQIKIIKHALKSHNLSAGLRQTLEQMLAANEAGGEIKKILDGLKPKIVKGRKPSDKPVDPNAFRSQMGSKEAQKLVTDAIQKEISHQLDQYERAVTDYLQGIIDDIAKQTEITVKRSAHDPIMMMVLQRCFESKQSTDYKAGTYTFTNIKLNETGKTFAKKEAKDQRDGLEKRFLLKNVKKLSHIVDLKGSLEKIETLPRKPVRVQAGSGTLEAGFTFKFTDSSQFTVINKIVTKYSGRGKPFEQFPTTFHDVTFPDKTKMKSPSEEKMVKEFGAFGK